VKAIDEELVDADSLTIRVGSRVRIQSGVHKGLSAEVLYISEQRYVIVSTPTPSSFRSLSCKTCSCRVRLYPSEEKVSLSLYRLVLDNGVKSTAPAAEQRRRPSSRCEPVKWLRPNLRVRIVSKSLRGGKFYRKKGRVDDIVSSTRVSLLMDDGQLVDDVRERDVETLVPAVQGTPVLILSGILSFLLLFRTTPGLRF
jgi:G patch domain/KOW motif-containing protein